MAKKTNKHGSSALDLAMAAFAATAAGFVIYAMPGWQFDRVIELSGLPMILSAAQPPLGNTARIAAIAAAVAGTWTLVWLVLRALSKKPAQAKRTSKPVEIEVPLPRLRRADAHPDAPARRPILAGLELGVPLDRAMEAQEKEAEEASFEELHDEEPPLEQVQDDDFSQEQIQEEETAPEPPLPTHMAAEAEEEHEAEFELEDENEIPEVRDSISPAHPAGDHEQASIAHLMQRLELGLLRRERSTWEAPDAEVRQNNEPNPQLDQRLRSAIDDLQRLASRGG